MTQIANQASGFKSEVLTDGGSIQKSQEREAKNEHAQTERRERATFEKLATQTNANIANLREERKSDLSKAGRKQKPESKPQLEALIDGLTKTPSRSTTEPKEGLVKTYDKHKVVTTVAPKEKATEGLKESLLTPIDDGVHIPASMMSTQVKSEPLPAYDLDDLLPAPTVINGPSIAQEFTYEETSQELMKRILNPHSDHSINADVPSEIKSKRGSERVQKIINEKRDLENQVEDLQYTVARLQDVLQKYEIEDELVTEVMTMQEGLKKPAAMVSEAKSQILKYLNTREQEVDHSIKAECFNKYMTDPFYMQVFVQNSEPDQWQSTIECIYDSIQSSDPQITHTKPAPMNRPQPISARTSTLGAPLASSDKPMDRIAQHLGNMGI